MSADSFTTKTTSYARPKPRTGKRQRPVMALSAILPEVGRQLNLDRTVCELAVLALWPQIIPEAFRTTTWAERLHQGTLFVGCTDAPTASQLTFDRDVILAKLNQYAPQTGIRLQALRIRQQSRP